MPRNKSKKPATHSTFENQILQTFQKNPFAAYNYKQVAKALNVKDTASKGLIRQLLAGLYKRNEIIEIRQGKYKLNPSLIEKQASHQTYIAGRVDMKASGKAYVISAETEEDIFINAGNTGRALHGDQVKVFLFPTRRNRKPEGQIVEVLQRRKTRFVGILQRSKHFSFLVPDNSAMPVDMFISNDYLNEAQNGEKVIAELTDWPENSKNPFGKIVERLGLPGDHHVEMKSILTEYNFPTKFSAAVEDQASKIPVDILPSEISRRRDFRQVTTFTIDPVDAKDFDDAISIQALEGGLFEIGVHIADVSYYIQEGTVLDQEAYNRATSVYLVDRVIPMLPERLSNGVCSLRPNEEKLCFAVVFKMDANAEVKDIWFGKTVICSTQRFTYEEVQEIIAGNDTTHRLQKEVLQLNTLSQILRAKRFSAGAINFHSIDIRFTLDKNNRPTGVEIKEHNESHQLIEELMLLANKKVAEWINDHKENKKAKTFVYRVHEQPNPDKLETFKNFVAKIGYTIKTGSRKTISDSLNKLLKDITGKPEEYMISEIAIRTMEKAYYTTNNAGHYGLSFADYTHFTSPIRRYPDLMVHRLLHAYLTGQPSGNRVKLEQDCEHCSEQEKNASQAERDSVKYKQVEFLLDKTDHVFEGIISGVSKWGIYVEIIENKCEGMVSLKDMEGDYYSLDDENYCVVGLRNRKVFKMGDKVKIKVKSANLSKKQLNYVFV